MMSNPRAPTSLDSSVRSVPAAALRGFLKGASPSRFLLDPKTQKAYGIKKIAKITSFAAMFAATLFLYTWHRVRRRSDADRDAPLPLIWWAMLGLTAVAEVIKRGQRVGLVECTVTDEQGRMVARASSTCLTLRAGEEGGGAAREEAGG